MKTKLENLEQFKEWFWNLSHPVQLRKVNEALEFHKLGVLCPNDEASLREVIEAMFGTDVLEVSRNSHKIRVWDEALFYCSPYSDEIVGVDWGELAQFIEDELYGGWEGLAEHMGVIFEDEE